MYNLLMKEYKIFPIFTTGPALVDSKNIAVHSDRTKIIKQIKKRGFLHFEPDILGDIAKKYSGENNAATYCLRNSFAFEYLLSNISLYNILLPISSSAIYELGQFHMNNTNKSIFVPKDKTVNGGNQFHKMPSLNYYIKLNHEMDFKYYTADSKGGFSDAKDYEFNWKLNILFKKIRERDVNLNIRTLGKGDKFNRNIFSHVVKSKNINDARIYVPLRIMYCFAIEILQNNSFNDLKTKNYFSKLLKDTIANYYESSSDNITFYYDNFKMSKKMIFMAMYVIERKTNPIMIIKKQKEDKTETEIISFRKRKIEIYKKTKAGDNRKALDRKILDGMNNCINSFKPSDITHAYTSGKNWLTNVSSHSKTLFAKENKRKIIFKTDIIKFFESINIGILEEKLSKMMLHTENDVKSTMPGLILSAMYSNIYLHDFDIEMSKYCKDNFLVISRYSDDIMVSTTSNTETTFDIEEVKHKISDELKKVKLRLNDKKTKTVDLNKKYTEDIFMRDGSTKTVTLYEEIKVTGVIIRKGGLFLSKRHVDKINAWIRNPNLHKLTLTYIKEYIKDLWINNIEYGHFLCKI